MEKVKWLIIKSNHIKETTRNALFSSNTIILTLSRTLIPILSNGIPLMYGRIFWRFMENKIKSGRSVFFA
jgi:hypothetical protein